MSRTICYLLVLALTVGTVPVAPRTGLGGGPPGLAARRSWGSATPGLNRLDATLRDVVASGDADAAARHHHHQAGASGPR